jgi:hypothetical protein
MRFGLTRALAALIVATGAFVQSVTNGMDFIPGVVAPAQAATADPVQADTAKFLALYQSRNYEAASVMAPALLDELRARNGADNPYFIQILTYVADC